MQRRIILVHGAAASARSPLAQQLADLAQRCDAVVTSAHGLEEAAAAVAGAAASAGALLCVIDPDVQQPFPVARRLAAAAAAELRFVFAVEPSREAAIRREAVYAAPAGNRWTLAAADDAGLLRLMTDALLASEQQARLRTTLDRMKLRLATPSPVDSGEYRRLIASDRYLASVLQNAPDAIVSVDLAGNVVSWNRGAERIFGISAATAQRSPLAACFADPPQFEAALGAALVGTTPAAEFGLRGADQRFVEARFDRLADDHGSAFGVGLILRETTERRRDEEALRAAGRQKDEFLAMLAHELRNPLAPIRNAAQILRLLRLGDARAQHATAIITRQVEHMAGLIDDLLDVARVTRGAVELDRQPLPVSAAVADAVEQVRGMIESRKHRLTVVDAGATARVSGDRKRLTQVFANLLSNSAKYTPEGGEISVESRIEGDQVQVCVADNGAGMASDLLPRVFDLFSQGERGPDRAQGGLGVGLALVRTLVLLHGGTIAAQSAGLGRGSRFVVSLPLLQDGLTAPAAITAAPGQGGAGNRLHLMVVDDNADAAQTLAMLLEAHGHSVDVEIDPRVALNRAESLAPDVFILDIGMPHLDGYELARRIRSSTLGSRAVLIALTGYGQPGDKLRARDAGFDHHLVKPLDPAVLTALLERMTPGLRH